MLVAFLGLSANLMADNLEIGDAIILKGATQTVSIKLTNTRTNYVGFQMDLYLPDGVTIDKSQTTLSNRFASGESITIGKQTDGAYRLVYTSLSLTPITGTSGTIINLALKASDTSTGGTATVQNVLFGTANSESITLEDVSFNVSVTDQIQDMSTAELSIPQGKEGVLTVQMGTSLNDYLGFQFDLTLPDGFSLVKNSNGKVATPEKGTKLDDTYVVAHATQKNGDERYLVYSTVNNVMETEAGSLLLIKVKNDNATLGSHQGTIYNISFSAQKDDDIVEVQVPDFTYTITSAEPYTMGDVNNDGVINVVDVSQTVSAALGIPPASFIIQAADMNNDGKISITDVSSIISLVVGE